MTRKSSDLDIMRDCSNIEQSIDPLPELEAKAANRPPCEFSASFVNIIDIGPSPLGSPWRGLDLAAPDLFMALLANDMASGDSSNPAKGTHQSFTQVVPTEAVISYLQRNG